MKNNQSLMLAKFYLLQWTVDKSNCHETEKIVRVDERIRDTESFFLKQATKGPENLFEQSESSD